jgi:hypothetical protein
MREHNQSMVEVRAPRSFACPQTTPQTTAIAAPPTGPLTTHATPSSHPWGASGTLIHLKASS